MALISLHRPPNDRRRRRPQPWHALMMGLGLPLLFAVSSARAEDLPEPMPTEASNATPATADAADPIPNKPRKLQLIAPTEVRELLLLAMPVLRPDGLQGRSLAEANLTDILSEIREILAAEAWFDPVIQRSAPKNTVSADGDADWVITVQPGPRTVVAEVEIRFEGAIQQAEYAERRAALRQQWRLPAPQALRSEAWEAAKRDLLERVRQTAFLRAELTQSRADVREQRADLSLTIDSGPSYEVGSVQITGLRRYRPELVLALEPAGLRAQPFDADKLLAWQVRLAETGYFRSVAVVPDLEALNPPESASNPASAAAASASAQVPLRIELQEQPRQLLTMAAGLSSDQGLRLSGGYQHRAITDWGAYPVWLSSSLSWTELLQRAEFKLKTPYDASNVAHGLDSKFEQASISGESTQKSNLSLYRAQRRNTLETVWSVSWQQERRAIAGTATDHSQALILGYTWNWRHLDDRLNPRSGFSINAQLAGAAAGLVSDRSFVRSYLKALSFTPLPARQTLILAAELGAVWAQSRQDIPSENLFRAGGTQSLRGFRYQSIGVSEGAAIVGGRYLAITSAEWQFPLRAPWAGAVFIDAGQASDNPSALRRLNVGYGVGARVQTPIGPVNLDLAHGQGDASPQGRWRVHFSVGYAF